MRGQDSEPVELRPGSSARARPPAAELEQWAWRRVRSLRAFYSHLTAYVVVNFVLFLIDSTTPGPAWFYVAVDRMGSACACTRCMPMRCCPGPRRIGNSARSAT